MPFVGSLEQMLLLQILFSQIIHAGFDFSVASYMLAEFWFLKRSSYVSSPRLLTGSILAHEMMHAWLRLKGALIWTVTSLSHCTCQSRSLVPRNYKYPHNPQSGIGSKRRSWACSDISIRSVYLGRFVVPNRLCDEFSDNYFIGYRTLRQDVEEGICQVVAHMWLVNELRSGSSIADVASSSSQTSKGGVTSPFEKKLGEFFKHQIESDNSPVYGDGFRAGYQAVKKYGLASTLSHIWMTGTFPSWWFSASDASEEMVHRSSVSWFRRSFAFHICSQGGITRRDFDLCLLVLGTAF